MPGSGAIVLYYLAATPLSTRGTPQHVILWVPENYVTSCDLRIFMDQAAEPVPPRDPEIRVRSGRMIMPSGRALEERPVRAMNVKVLDVVLAENPIRAAHDTC